MGKKEYYEDDLRDLIDTVNGFKALEIPDWFYNVIEDDYLFDFDGIVHDLMDCLETFKDDIKFYEDHRQEIESELNESINSGDYNTEEIIKTARDLELYDIIIRLAMEGK